MKVALLSMDQVADVQAAYRRCYKILADDVSEVAPEASPGFQRLCDIMVEQSGSPRSLAATSTAISSALAAIMSHASAAQRRRIKQAIRQRQQQLARLNLPSTAGRDH